MSRSDHAGRPRSSARISTRQLTLAMVDAAIRRYERDKPKWLKEEGFLGKLFRPFRRSKRP